MASAVALSEEIDFLLERYLELLDTYTSLRKELSTHQSSVHQHIARANFSADRGIRYGQDLYDERMQASRACSITVPASSSAEFTVAAHARTPTAVEVADKENEEPSRASGDEQGEPAKGKAVMKKDPIRMFGILVPQSLRMAQGEAIKMVEDIVPKIASIDAEMKEVEIKIRRARKHKAKAEITESKLSLEGEMKALPV